MKGYEILKCAALVLTVVVFCHGAKLYVKPTVPPSSTVCPGQPCFTLAHYSSQSALYFRSNTTFLFLPGFHYVNETVLFKDVNNISLMSFNRSLDIEVYLVLNCTIEHRVLHGEVHSESFAATNSVKNIHSCSQVVAFENVSSIIVRGISMSATVSSAVGLLLNGTASSYLEQNSFSCDVDKPGSGLQIHNTDSATINTAYADGFFHGISLIHSTNILVLNMKVMYNRAFGAVISNSANISLSNVLAIGNTKVGISVYKSNNTIVSNADLSYCGWEGIDVMFSNFTVLDNISSQFGGVFGGYFALSNFTTIRNSVFSHSAKLHGIYVDSLAFFTIYDVQANNNNMSGLFVTNCSFITVSHSLFSQNFIGIYASNINTLSVRYSEIRNSSTTQFYGLGMGMWVVYCNNLSISHSTVLYSRGTGITVGEGNSLTVEHTVLKYNLYSGITLSQNTANVLKNVTVLFCSMNILIEKSVDSYVLNTTVSSSQMSCGLTHFSSRDTYVENLIVLSYNIFNEPSMNVLFLFLDSFLITNSSNVTVTTTQLTDLQRGISVFISSNVSIISSHFLRMKPLTFASDPTSLPSAVLLYHSTVTISNCSFSDNEVSAIKMFSSNLTLDGEMSFVNNISPSGPAFILSKDSVLILSKNSHTTFANNRATNTGGVFYIDTNPHYNVIYVDNRATVVVVGTSCFLKVDQEDGSQKLMTFTNNTAGYGGDLIFGGKIARSWDGELNCLVQFEEISQVLPPYNNLSLISSSPSRVCLCSQDGSPNCSDVIHHHVFSVYPGENFSLLAVVTGQNFGTVAGSVYAQFLRQSNTCHLPVLESWQYTQGVAQQSCNNLSFTVFSGTKEGSNEVLIFTVDDNVVSTIPDRERVRQTFDMWRSTHLNKSDIDDAVFTSVVYEYPVYVNVTILPCPVGFQLIKEDPKTKCGCSDLLQTLPNTTKHTVQHTRASNHSQWLCVDWSKTYSATYKSK